MNEELEAEIKNLREEVNHWKELYNEATDTVQAYRELNEKHAAAAKELNKLLAMMLEQTQPVPWTQRVIRRFSNV